VGPRGMRRRGGERGGRDGRRPRPAEPVVTGHGPGMQLQMREGAPTGRACNCRCERGPRG
jgi:hypothetical protein